MPLTSLAGTMLVHPVDLDPQWILSEPDTYGFAFRRFEGEGGITFRGGGGVTEDDSLWFGDERYTIEARITHSIQASSFERRRQFYEIRPVIHATGVLAARSGGRSLFEDPALRCALRVSQLVATGNASGSGVMVFAPVRTSGAIEEVLIDIHRRSNVRRKRVFGGREPKEPERLPVSPVYVELDGTQHLLVSVLITFEIWRDASGTFTFSGIPPDDRFRIGVPPWWVAPFDSRTFR